MIKNFTTWLNEAESADLIPTKGELETFTSILDEAKASVEELWASGKCESVVLRCGWVDYRYDTLGDGLIQHPDKRYDRHRTEDAIDRFMKFVILGTGKTQWGPDASLFLFRVTEEAKARVNSKKLSVNHYQLEYDWNPETSSIELVKERSGLTVGLGYHGKHVIEKRTKEIAAIIDKHIAKKYKFPRIHGNKYGL